MSSASIPDISQASKIPCLINHSIDNHRYLLQKQLGIGGYSVVYLATDLRSRKQDQVAVKCLLHQNSEQRDKNLYEVSLHRRASCLPGVVNLYHTVEEDGLLFVVLEYCKDGDLFTMIAEKMLYVGRDELIKSVFLQLLDTVRGLHAMGIYHRDLKPENILCNDMGRRLLVADFGLATEKQECTVFGCGSHFYMSPECLAGCYTSALRAYSARAADIWSLGVILLNMATSRSPWKYAMSCDPSFHRYTRNPQWLRQLLPISGPAFVFANRIFLNHGNNLALAELRALFIKIETFYMSDMELADADEATRAVARDWQARMPHNDSIAKGHNSSNTSADKASDSALSVVLVDSNPLEIDPESDDIREDQDAIFESQSLSSSSTSSSLSDLLITPESRPAVDVEDVPDLPKGQSIGLTWANEGSSELDTRIV